LTKGEGLSHDLSTWELDPSEIKVFEQQKLGKGTFGSVVKGMSGPVAIALTDEVERDLRLLFQVSFVAKWSLLRQLMPTGRPMAKSTRRSLMTSATNAL